MQQLYSYDQKMVLASGSSIRASLLRNAGFDFEIMPSSIDESAIYELSAKQSGSLEPADVAELLARTKAEAVSAMEPDALVIGADQTLSVGDRIYRKCNSMDEARETLLSLRAQTHQLNSAVCVAERGEVIWSYTDRANLTMTNFSPEFLGRYLGYAGAEILNSVGAYQLEGLGIHLFEKIQGDYFSILGLPMLPFVKFFRQRVSENQR